MTILSQLAQLKALAEEDVSPKTRRRFWSKVQKGAPDECWNWTASKNEKGYGYFSVKDTIIRSHRMAFILHTGKNPRPLHVLHSCDNPSCVNPAHLFTGTNTDNVRDCVKKGRHCEQRKTHCVNGHPFIPENMLFYRKWRTCRICQRARDAKWQANQRAQQPSKN